MLPVDYVDPYMIDPASRRTSIGRVTWAATVTIGIAFSFATSVSFPYFSIVMALIASTGDLASADALPAMLNLKLLGDRMSKWAKLLCYNIIPVSLVLSALGVYSSLASLIHEAAQQH